MLVPIIFTLIFATVLAHSFSLGYLGRWLGLASKKGNRVVIVGASPFSTELAKLLQEEKVGVLLVDSSWHRLRDARLSGVPVYYGEILSDNAEESLELNDVGTLLAATSNDAYNALICTSFGAEMGRSKVFQLPMYSDEDDPRALARANRGQVAFGENAVYEELWSHLAAGWSFHRTPLTEDFGWQEYLEECVEGTIQVLLISAEGDVVIHSPQNKFSPRPGDMVVSFGPEKTGSLRETLSKPAAEEDD